MASGLAAYLGSCRRRRITRVEGPIFLRWTGGSWLQTKTRWHWHRAQFSFVLWPCRHFVTLRLRRGDFPTSAMRREPYAVRAWVGRDCPCTICGPAERPEDRLDAPRARADVGWLVRRSHRRRRKWKTAPRLPDLPPQVQQLEDEEAYRRDVIGPLAAAYDS